MITEQELKDLEREALIHRGLPLDDIRRLIREVRALQAKVASQELLVKSLQVGQVPLGTPF